MSVNTSRIDEEQKEVLKVGERGGSVHLRGGP